MCRFTDVPKNNLVYLTFIATMLPVSFDQKIHRARYFYHLSYMRNGHNITSVRTNVLYDVRCSANRTNFGGSRRLTVRSTERQLC